MVIFQEMIDLQDFKESNTSEDKNLTEDDLEFEMAGNPTQNHNDRNGSLQEHHNYHDCSSIEVTSMPNEKNSFPYILHSILSNPMYCDIITWLPHGRSWKVRKPKAFEEQVIPLYFRHRKLASFMRQVNGWGFRRKLEGIDCNSYYHEVIFLDQFKSQPTTL